MVWWLSAETREAHTAMQAPSTPQQVPGVMQAPLAAQVWCCLPVQNPDTQPELLYKCLLHVLCSCTLC